MWYVFSPRLLPPSQSCFLWPQQSRFGSALPSRIAQAEKKLIRYKFELNLKRQPVLYTQSNYFELLLHLCDSWELPNGGQDQPAAYVDHTNLGGLSANRFFFCSVCWFSNHIRKQTHFCWFSNQLSKLTSLAARFTLQKKLTRLNSPWEKGTMAWDQDESYCAW